MRRCVYCGGEVAENRPLDHCTNKVCVDTWIATRRARLRLMLMHKQGYTLTEVEEDR